MATWKSFEEIDAWKKSGRLVCDIYRVTREGEFQRDFALRDQIRKSAISIPSNIAEGFERDSLKAFISFLHIAKGSAGELRTQIYIAGKLEYLDPKQRRELVAKAKDVSRMLSGLIRYLTGRPPKA